MSIGRHYYEGIPCAGHCSPGGVLAAVVTRGQRQIDSVPVVQTWPWEFDIFRWHQQFQGRWIGCKPRGRFRSLPDSVRGSVERLLTVVLQFGGSSDAPGGWLPGPLTRDTPFPPEVLELSAPMGCPVVRGEDGDAARRQRRALALALGTIRAVLDADAPRVTCPQHGVVVAAAPWAAVLTVDGDGSDARRVAHGGLEHHPGLGRRRRRL